MLFKKKPPVTTDTTGRRRPIQTGLPAAPVFSYHANRSAPTPDRPERGTEQETNRRQVKQPWWRHRAVLVLGGVIILAAVALNMPVSGQPKLVVQGKRSVFLQPKTVYEAAARAELAKSFLNTTKLTVQTKVVEDALREQFPELAAVTVAVPLVGHQLAVHVEPAVPVLLLKTVGGDQFVLDRGGRAIISATQAPNLAQLNLPTVIDQSPVAVQQGKPVLPTTNVAFITEVIAQLQAKKLGIASLTLPAGTSELDVRLNGVPYTVKFNLRGDPTVGAGTYLATKQQLERDHRTPSSYVDVRVDERAYYR